MCHCHSYFTTNTVDSLPLEHVVKSLLAPSMSLATCFQISVMDGVDDDTTTIPVTMIIAMSTVANALVRNGMIHSI